MNDIIGNTVATPYPRPDWNQTDATKPDYIKNKPDLGGTVAVTYSNSSAPINTVGGISPSTFPDGFENKTFADIMDAMFYPYTKPLVGTLTLDPPAGTKKKGDPLTVSTASATVTKKSKDIVKIEVYKGSTLVTSTNQTISGKETVIINIGETLNGNSNTTYKLRAIDTEDGYTESSATYTFVNPYYIAVLNIEDEINEANIINGTEKIEPKDTTKTYFYTTTPTQFPVIAYPKSYGELSSIKDANGFTQTWKLTEISINDVYYYVYSGGGGGAENFKYTFTY